MVNRRLGIGVLMMVLGEARADDMLITDCDELEDALEDQCVDGNTLTMEDGLDCPIAVFVEGACTLRAETPCGARIDNGGSYEAIVIDDGDLRIEGVALACSTVKNTTSLIYTGSSPLQVKDACLDGTECQVALLTGGNFDDRADQLSIEGSDLTGPIVSLTDGAASLIIQDSIIRFQADYEDPAIDIANVDLVEISRTLWLSDSTTPTLRASGTGEIRLSNSPLVLSGDAPILSLEGADALDLSLDQVAAHHAEGAAALISADGGSVSFLQSLVIGFDLAVDGATVTVTGEDVRIVDGDALPDDVDAERFDDLLSAGVSGLDTPFCAIPPWCTSVEDCASEAVCLEDQPLWPTDGCSALVLTDDDGGYAGQVGLLGDLALADLPQAPPWASTAGDVDGDGVIDDADGDGWPDVLDADPLSDELWRPAWFAVTEDGCALLLNTCSADLDPGTDWQAYDEQAFASACPDGADSGSGTGTGEDDMLVFGCGRGERILTAAFLLIPGLWTLTRRRRSRR